jgi:hypothetical protein
MKSIGSLSAAPASAALLLTLSGAVCAPSVAAAVTRTLTLSGTPPASVTIPNTYSFQPVAYDSVKGKLHYAIQNMPAWVAQFNTDTGLLVGRPNAQQVGVYNNIRIRVTDSYGYAELAFSVKVLGLPPKNAPPTISGKAPTSVPVETAYNFTPIAADPERQALTFGINNKPSWVKFNAASGSLSGTPGAADVGSYANVRISVSDGQASASLPPFTVTVNQIATHNVTVDWMPSTENADGSVLTDLAGYRIHYGTSKDSLTKIVNITNPGLASYVVDQLTTGNWYFGMTSYSTSGAESPVSGVVSTIVQ